MLADELGTFLAQQRTDDLPAELMDMAKLRLLDLLGAGLAGYGTGLSRPLLNVLGLPPGRSLIWGQGVRSSARTAATLNAFMAHCTYLEDGSRSTGGHPSSTVIPAVLALAEERDLSGLQLILGIVSGYEVFLRIGEAIYPETVSRGFQPTAILASLAAAGGCAALLDLNPGQCANALAIAANFGAGLKSALKEPSTQPLQVGRSCEGGLLAALMAEQGMKGYGPNLEAFIQAHGGSIPTEGFLTDLGRKWKMSETYLKIHGGCRGNHAPIDAVIEVVQAHSLSVEQIETVRIGIDKVTAAAEISRPQTGGQAQFSIPFSVAVALLYGNASLFQFTDQRLREPHVQALMNKIHVEIDPEMNALLPTRRGATVKIRLRNGTFAEGRLLHARGEPEAPISSEEVCAKFLLTSDTVLGPAGRQVIEYAEHLETLVSVNELTPYLMAERAL
jgi:2-methylcitrate dehydratase PrpD